jgi:hypothetical protein
MKSCLVLVILSMYLSYSAQAALDPDLERKLNILVEGRPGSRTVITNARRISDLQARSRYGAIVTACNLNSEVKGLVECLVRALDLMPGAHAALSETKGKGARGRRRLAVAEEMKGFVSPLSTPTSLSGRSLDSCPSSASASSDSSDESPARSLSRSKLERVVDTVVRALSPSRSPSRPPSPKGAPLSSAKDLSPFQTPVMTGAGVAARALEGGRPRPIDTAGAASRSSSVARTRSFFNSPLGTPSGAPDSEKEALRAKVTALEAWKASHEAGGGSKLSEEKAKVTALTTQLGAMMEEVARAKAETAVFEERLRVAERKKEDKVREKTSLSARVEALTAKLERAEKEKEELAAQLKRAQTESLALTSRLSSTQKTNAELLGRIQTFEGGEHVASAHFPRDLGVSGKAPPVKKVSWFGKS